MPFPFQKADDAETGDSTKVVYGKKKGFVPFGKKKRGAREQAKALKEKS